MRLSLPVLVATVVALAGVTAPAVAAAATTPVVGRVQVAGSAPGGLVRTTGSGFAAGSAVDLTLTGAAVSVVLARTTADPTGQVSVPAGTRIPATAKPGSYTLVLGTSGGPAATSPPFSLLAPGVSMPPRLIPGHPAYLLHDDLTISLFGLASSPDVTRTVTIDDVPVTSSRWYSDVSSFLNPGIAFEVPPSLAVGPHRVRFEQTGATPFTTTATVSVDPPVARASTHIPQGAAVGLDIRPTAWNDDYDVTVVGAAGDRHTGLHWTRVNRADGTSTSTARVAPGRVSPGTATLTAVSRVNGATASTTFVVDPDVVTSGLASGARIVTSDGDTELLMQPDGNLVHRYNQQIIWSSNTSGNRGARLTVQSDGNVVIRTTAGRPVWSTGTAGTGPGARLGFDAQLDVALRTASGRQTWSPFRNTSQLVDRLRPGNYLFKGQCLATNLDHGSSGYLCLTMGGDGNVVVRAQFSGVLWQTRTAGHPNAYLTLQTDGNLVLRGPNGAVLWANGVRGTPGATLAAQRDGNVVERNSRGRAVWSTGTRVT